MCKGHDRFCYLVMAYKLQTLKCKSVFSDLAHMCLHMKNVIHVHLYEYWFILTMDTRSFFSKHVYLSQLMRLWYLSHRQPTKAQASLHISAVSLEPSLFAHMKYGSRRRVRPKIRHLAHWMAAHEHLKNEFMEDEKYHNLITWLIYLQSM